MTPDQFVETTKIHPVKAESLTSAQKYEVEAEAKNSLIVSW
jgi:hypothetical protein